jgi:hypothetical protein
MKAVIQHAGTAQFLTARGTWTPNPNEALAFLDEVRARDYAYLHEVNHSIYAVLDEQRGRLVTRSKEARNRKRPVDL